MLTVKRSIKIMTNKYRFLKKIDNDVITLTRNTLYKKCYVNKREIEIKNRPVFVLFSKLYIVYDLSNCCVTFALVYVLS
jgi:hypothetical protein